MGNVQYVRPWEVKPGDRITGSDMVVSGFRYEGQHALGGDVERQRYTVTMTDGRTITYGGDSKVSVVR